MKTLSIFAAVLFISSFAQAKDSTLLCNSITSWHNEDVVEQLSAQSNQWETLSPTHKRAYVAVKDLTGIDGGAQAAIDNNGKVIFINLFVQDGETGFGSRSATTTNEGHISF